MPLIQMSVLAVLGLVVGPIVAAEQRGHEAHAYSVRLIDGSRVILGLCTEQISIDTAYGKLKVPVADIRRIDVGRHHVTRDKADSKPPNEFGRPQEDDVIVTSRFPIVGRIEESTVKVDSQIFGQTALRLVDTLQFRSTALESTTERDEFEPA